MISLWPTKNRCAGNLLATNKFLIGKVEKFETVIANMQKELADIKKAGLIQANEKTPFSKKKKSL